MSNGATSPNEDESHDQKIRMSLEQLELDLNRVKNLFKLRKFSSIPENKPDQMHQRSKQFLSTNDDNIEIRKRNGMKASKQQAHSSPDMISKSRSRHRPTTLAVISLDTTPTGTDNEDSPVRYVKNRRSASNSIRNNLDPSASHSPAKSMHETNEANRNQANNNNNNNAPSVKELEGEEAESEYCCIWPFSLLVNRPVLRLFIIMFLNGVLSIISAAIIMEIELPAQRERQARRLELQTRVDNLYKNLTLRIEEMGTDDYDGDLVVDLLEQYNDAVPEVAKSPEEIEWNMLSAQAFITSVQTTTGYGDIIPVTFWGKFFTLVYASVGIPVFMWYIFKLGALFRLIVMKLIFWFLLIFCPYTCSSPKTEDKSKDQDDTTTITTLTSGNTLHPPEENQRRRSTLTRLKLIELSMRLKQQYYDDKRFHPSIIGVILLIFLCSVAFFISYMEGYSYFNSFYACFITYSTIGFGDIDIFKISYRSNWFNLMIYGNFVHIVGYMILSAWVSSLLEKCGVRKF